jgi:hypothetical protein
MKNKIAMDSPETDELLDLFINIGILQELNRTFLNPLGLNLLLNKKAELKLEKTENPEGVIQHTVDTFRLKVFNEYRNKKHKERLEKTGFIIQTKDVPRKDALAKDKDLSLSSPENLKLKKLLTCVDNVAYKIKHNFMQNSKEKDKDAASISFSQLYRKMEMDFELGNFIEGIAKAILIYSQEDIESELEKIKKIKEKQDKIFGGKNR